MSYRTDDMAGEKQQVIRQDADRATVPVGILCVGNLLARDDGVGPRVAAELCARFELPPEVEVMERGVMGMALIADMRRFARLLIVDAVDKTGYAPGTLVSFAPEDIASYAPYAPFRGAHDARLVDVLEALALLGEVPPTSCLGVQVLDSAPEDFSIGLTPPVEAAVPLMVKWIVDFLIQQGIHLKGIEPTTEAE